MPFCVAVGAALLGLGCTAGHDEAPATKSVSVRVMEFNVEYGGTLVDFDKVVEAVRLANADIVALEEPYGNARRLAEALGWEHASARTDVISRYPLLDPPGADGRYIWAELRPGQVAAIANVHLPSDPYGPYFSRVCPPEALIRLERETRLPAIAPLLERLQPLVARGVPVFLLGDFNAPSHRDWITPELQARPQIAYPLAWPVSLAVEAAGFTDSYRAVYPDAVEHPGLTWWAARPNIEDEFPATDPLDRIDFIYGANAEAVSSQVIGEAGADVDVSVSPWPSDHRALVSEFVVRPSVVPAYVSVERRLSSVGESVPVRVGGAPEARFLSLVPAGAPASAPELLRLELRGALGSERLDVPTHGLLPGAYELRLISGGTTIAARAPLWIQEQGGTPGIVVDAETYASGEPIGVRWFDAPGNRWDWVGIYRAPADPSSDDYLVWSHLGARVEGALTLDQRAPGGAWPLEAGSYEALLLLYDAYDVAARTSFEISAEPRPVPAPPANGATWDAACRSAVAR